MNGKKIGIIMTVLCVLLLAGNGALYMMNRESKPVITFGKNAPVYKEDITEEELLSNVKASDQQDGDLTGKVMVDKKVKTEGGVKVTYLVADSNNHITTAFQILKGEGNTAEETSAEVQEATETPTPEPTATPEPTPTVVVDPEAPTITLAVTEATVKVGETFEYGNYLADFADNKDSQERLAQDIHVEGADTSTPGVKEVHYYVIDSDGNRSPDAILTLTVQ